MGFQYNNAVNNSVNKRRCGHKSKLDFRNESSIITGTYDNTSFAYVGSSLNFKIIDELPLTNAHLSGNLVIDNLRRLESWQDTIKANSERSEDAKQCIPLTRDWQATGSRKNH